MTLAERIETLAAAGALVAACGRAGSPATQVAANAWLHLIWTASEATLAERRAVTAAAFTAAIEPRPDRQPSPWATPE